MPTRGEPVQDYVERRAARIRTTSNVAAELIVSRSLPLSVYQVSWPRKKAGGVERTAPPAGVRPSQAQQKKGEKRAKHPDCLNLRRDLISATTCRRPSRPSRTQLRH